MNILGWCLDLPRELWAKAICNVILMGLVAFALFAYGIMFYVAIFSDVWGAP